MPAVNQFKNYKLFVRVDGRLTFRVACPDVTRLLKMADAGQRVEPGVRRLECVIADPEGEVVFE